jgi:hypothetical protein
VEEAFGNILAKNCRSTALKRESAICRTPGAAILSRNDTLRCLGTPYSRVKYEDLSVKGIGRVTLVALPPNTVREVAGYAKTEAPVATKPFQTK